jgi:hypothetical protein
MLAGKGAIPYLIIMSETNTPMPSLAKTAGAVGTFLLGINVLTSLETTNHSGHQQAQFTAQAKAIAAATPRCAGKQVQVYTGLTPCQSQTLTAQIEAERQALSGMMAQNRATQLTR